MQGVNRQRPEGNQSNVNGGDTDNIGMCEDDNSNMQVRVRSDSTETSYKREAFWSDNNIEEPNKPVKKRRPPTPICRRV